MAYKKTYNPCDDCPYSFSKNNQGSNTCKICEFKELLDKYQNDTRTPKERGGEKWKDGSVNVGENPK